MVQLNWKVAAMAVTGATAVVGWVAAPARVTSRVVPAPQRSTVAAPPAVHVTRVPAAPQPTAARPRIQTSRNPFRFPPVAERRAVPPSVVPEVVAPAVERAPVPFYLSGVAHGGDAREPHDWIAVLGGGPNGVQLARVGDVLADRYRVTRLDENSVTIVDQQDGRESTLALGQRP